MIRQRIILLLYLIGLIPIRNAFGFEVGEKVSFSGYLQSDLRYIIEDNRGSKPNDGYYFEMNRNDLDLKLKIRPDENVHVYLDSRFRFYGFSKFERLSDLSSRDALDPYSFQLNEAYLAVKGFIWDKMDLKIGRMIQNWGSADMFNPTDNLSARDFSDPLDYFSKVPNQMIEIDMYPADWLSISLVWVPFFRPSLLPPSSSLGFMPEYDKNGCFVSAPAPPLDKGDAQKLKNMFASLNPCSLSFLMPEVKPILPENNLENSQAATRIKFRLGAFDLGLSYYYGRFSFPVAYTAVAEVLSPSSQPNLDPNKTYVKYTAEVMYPRMHVTGLDFSYSAEWLFDVGMVGEIAVIFPEKVIFGLNGIVGGKKISDLTMSSVNVPSTPFVKATFGLDYTFTRWLYANAMYVRGFFDEFNDRYGIHNYVVGMTDLKFFEDELQIRLTGMLNVDDLSAVAYPQVTWIPVPSVELTSGAFVYIGDTKPDDPLDYGAKKKFGQKAAGRSVAFLKAKVTW